MGPADARNKEAREWLFSLQSRGWRTSLDEMQKAMRMLGDPQNGLKAIHVAGTNGKGSVCAMASSILTAAGKRTGLYISPHLIDIRERISVDGRAIEEERLSELTIRIRNVLEQGGTPPTELSFFEFVTAIGFIEFAEREVDAAVFETGFGGRLDATNLLPSSVAVITQIGLDHTEYLGNTLEAIAGEKAGIIKKGCDVVSSAGESPAMAVVRKRAHELGCRLMENGKDFRAVNIEADLSGTFFDYKGDRVMAGLRTRLLGRHQAENAATAIAACESFARRQGFDIKDADISKGLLSVLWPGRMEIVSRAPLTILDCAHNPPAVKRAMASLEDLGVSPDTVVFAASRDKDYRTNASMIFPKAKRLVLTRYGSPRSLEPEKLAEIPEAEGKTKYISNDISEALEIAKDITPPDESILVIGSVFLVGDALSWLKHGVKADFSLAGF